ncbi:MAG TPA: tryptophan 7-halogenase [Acidimicrobiales bacterium]|nr:tryptophan 7-halogenase [Acidimicrobiales bacterium]
MKVLVTGAGMMGLCSAMLLAQDGHEVLVVERDPAEPPDPSLAWESWERRGVNQLRLAHFFLARFRSLAEAELPELAAALTAAGACRYNIVANIPDEMKGGVREGDDRFDCITGRRTVVEAVTASVAEETPGVTVRRGAAVAGLLASPSAGGGAPHVTGVELEDGERIEADLVVDATGRRSPLLRWLSDIGAGGASEALEDSGFIYYGRHFRSGDGSLPFMLGSLKQDYGSISVLTLPADNGTWSVTLIASSKDAAMRAVMDPAKWAEVVRMLPLAAHWIDAEPIDDGVAMMTKIEDRIRDFAPGGHPVVTGLLPVADSWSCTNPSLGRGVSIGMTHAVELRDLVRRSGDLDPVKLAAEWSEVTKSELQPWYDATVRYDRHRLDQIHALIDGRPYETDDEEWLGTRRLETSGLLDGDLLRANIDVAMCLRRIDEVLADPVVAGKLEGVAAGQGGAQLGPNRSQVLEVLG